jgi:hypothetical protein
MTGPPRLFRSFDVSLRGGNGDAAAELHSVALGGQRMLSWRLQLWEAGFLSSVRLV